MWKCNKLETLKATLYFIIQDYVTRSEGSVGSLTTMESSSTQVKMPINVEPRHAQVGQEESPTPSPPQNISSGNVVVGPKTRTFSTPTKFGQQPYMSIDSNGQSISIDISRFHFNGQASFRSTSKLSGKLRLITLVLT